MSPNTRKKAVLLLLLIAAPLEDEKLQLQADKLTLLVTTIDALRPRASDSFCLMVTMLVPRTEKYPYSLIFLGKTPPILAKTRIFVVRKIPLFSDFKESTLCDDPF